MLRTSEQIKKSVVEQLVWDSRVDASNISVEVSDGRVTLTGTVPSFMARQSAANDSWIIQGVNFVDNQLQVDPMSDKPKPLDNEIKEKIKNILLWESNILSPNVAVSVEDGEVTLEGSVDSFWKKIRTEELVSGVAGVCNMVNKLTVVPTENFVDKSIASDLMAAFERHSKIPEQAINARINNGHVILSGSVPDWYTFHAVFQTAMFTAGVKNVDNHLIIEGK